MERERERERETERQRQRETERERETERDRDRQRDRQRQRCRYYCYPDTACNFSNYRQLHVHYNKVVYNCPMIIACTLLDRVWITARIKNVTNHNVDRQTDRQRQRQREKKMNYT